MTTGFRHAGWAVAAAVLWCGVASAQTGKFEVLGIGGAGGMFTPAVSPSDPGLMFISCDMSGAYRSTDGGKHWQMIHWRQLNSSLSCRPLFLKNAILWVSGPTPKISRDKGVTWQPLVPGALPWGGEVNRMAAAADDDSVLLFGTSAGELWRSADAGRTWTLAQRGRVYSILPLGTKIYLAIGETFLISSDKGKSWEPVDLAASSPELKGKTFLSLAGGSAGGATVIYGPIFKAGMFRSLDEGKTWKKVDEFRDCNEVLMASNQTKVAYASQSGYGGATGFFRTVDGGATWTSCFRMGGANGNVELSWVQTSLGWGYYITPLGVGVSPTDARTALVSTQGDFYITRNAGDTWQQLMNIACKARSGDTGPRYECNGLEVTSNWQYLFDPNAKDRVYIAYTDIGFARSADLGVSWTPSANGCPWGNTFYQVAFDPRVKGQMYAATSNRHDIPNWTQTDKNNPGQDGGVCVSRDAGMTWAPLGKGLPKVPCTSVCVDPKSPEGALTLYAAMYEAGVFKSIDDGRTWVAKNNGLGNPGNLHVLSVKVHPKTGDLYCSITATRVNGNQFPVPGGLWKSTDGGENWADLTKDLKLHWPGNFAVHPDHPDVIYLTAATIPGGREGGVYGTTDGGKTWTRMMKDEDFAAAGGESYVQCFFVNLHPTRGDHVYLGTVAHGLWMSPDAGKTWKRFEALPFSSVTNVTFDPANPDMMYVCTFGGGVWRGYYLPVNN